MMTAKILMSILVVLVAAPVAGAQVSDEQPGAIQRAQTSSRIKKLDHIIVPGSEKRVDEKSVEPMDAALENLLNEALEAEAPTN